MVRDKDAPKNAPRLTAQIVALVDKATKAQIERIAKDGGISAGAVIRMALRYGLVRAAELIAKRKARP